MKKLLHILKSNPTALALALLAIGVATSAQAASTAVLQMDLNGNSGTANTGPVHAGWTGLSGTQTAAGPWTLTTNNINGTGLSLSLTVNSGNAGWRNRSLPTAGTLSDMYQSLLFAAGGFDLQLTGLTAGQKYKVNLYSWDSGGGNTGDAHWNYSLNGDKSSPVDAGWVWQPSSSTFTPAANPGTSLGTEGVAMLSATFTATGSAVDFFTVNAASTPVIVLNGFELYAITGVSADAGTNQTVSATAVPSVTIGGNPTASGGTGTYTYSWSPSTGLSSATVANPTASPTATTTFTVTVTDSASATDTASVVVNYVAENVSLVSIDFVYSLTGGNGAPYSGDTVLTGHLNKNAVGQTYTGQVGPWNALNTGGNNNTVSSASLTNILNGARGSTTVGFAMGTATTVGSSGGNWRNNYVSALASVGDGAALRVEEPYLYYSAITQDHFNWELAGLTPNAQYRLTVFGTGAATSHVATNAVNTAVSGVQDTEGDWDWTNITANAAGRITGRFTATNGTPGIYGLQLEALLAANAGLPQTIIPPGVTSVTIGGSPTASGGRPPYTYSWSPSTGLSSATVANPTASPTVTTTYTVTVTDSVSSNATALVVVTYAASLTANAGLPQTVSPSSPSVTLGNTPTAAGGTGPYTYSWSPSTALSSTTVANPTASPIATTTYTVTVTDATHATATASVVITYTEPALVVNAGVATNVTPNAPSVTIGGNPTASGGSGGGYTYSWTPSASLSSATVANPTASPTTTTTYTVTVTDSANYTGTATVVVSFVVPALTANAGANQFVSSITPSATIGGSPTAYGGWPPYTYSWTPTTALTSATVANPTASPTATTTYTVTVTDSTAATAAASVVVSYVVPNANLVSVKFVEAGGTPCSGDTVLTSPATMLNADGIAFTGQIGPWNPLDIGTYTSTSAGPSAYLTNGAGGVTTVQLATGSATGLPNPGDWRCNPNEGGLGGPNQLRAVEAYLYPGYIAGDGYGWAFTGLTPNAAYSIVWFGDHGNTNGASNVANGVPGTYDSEGDWNWDSITADGSGAISGTFTGPNPTIGLYGAQIELLGGSAPTPPEFPPSGFSLPGGVPTFQVPTESGPTYWLEYRDELSGDTWHALSGTGMGTGTGGTIILTDETASGQTQRFYRLGRNP